MSKVKSRKSFPFNRSRNYRNRVQGLLDKSWSEKLGGLHITECSLKDQGGPGTENISTLHNSNLSNGLIFPLQMPYRTQVTKEWTETPGPQHACG
jgi:hypothetical protein